MKILILLFAFLSVFCNESGSRINTDNNSFSSYMLNSNDVRKITLPDELREISGLALTEDGKLFANNDEEGKIFEIDLGSGKIVNTIKPEEHNIKEDFEGIASVENDLFLVTSGGEIYQFISDENKISLKKYKTELKSKNDIEGLCYYADNNSLLLLCKEDPGNGIKDAKTVYSFNLDEMKLNEKPFLTISLTDLNRNYGFRNFMPAGIEYNSSRGSFFILSSRTSAVIEISKEGKIIDAAALPGKYHKQPEGITFLQDNTMIISDEGGSGKGTLTFYPSKKTD